MHDFILPKLTCLRCKHKWTPRKPDIRVCSKCKSPYWNEKQKGGK